MPLEKSSCSQTSETHNPSASQIPEVSDCSPIPETSPAHDAFKNSDEYHTTNSYASISLMFKTLGLNQIEIDQILTDDVKTSKPFELCMKSLQQNYDTFKKLYDTYVNQSKLKENGVSCVYCCSVTDTLTFRFFKKCYWTLCFCIFSNFQMTLLLKWLG